MLVVVLNHECAEIFGFLWRCERAYCLHVFNDSRCSDVFSKQSWDVLWKLRGNRSILRMPGFFHGTPIVVFPLGWGLKLRTRSCTVDGNRSWRTDAWWRTDARVRSPRTDASWRSTELRIPGYARFIRTVQTNRVQGKMPFFRFSCSFQQQVVEFLAEWNFAVLWCQTWFWIDTGPWIADLVPSQIHNLGKWWADRDVFISGSCK